jgi:NADH-quinone oxidoreductase subunit J
MEWILFSFFSGLALLSGVMVIRSEQSVHSLLFLVLVFFNAAGLLLLLEVEFLAMLFIIVYVGAIAVLFLFVVMMLNLKAPAYKTQTFSYLPVGGLLLLLFLMNLLLLVEGKMVTPLSEEEASPSLLSWWTEVDGLTNVEVLGQVLYTYYAYYFLTASLILLVAMIGPIVLTMQLQYKVKRQQIFQQVSRTFASAVFLTRRQKDL